MRIVIAEDSGLLRHMLAETLTARGFTVIAQAGTLPEVLQAVAADPPDVAVLDIRMPPDHRDEGLRAAERIRADHPGTGLLVLSHYAETSYAMRLLKAADQAVGYLIKDRVRDADRLVDAIKRVASGEVVVDPEVVQRVLTRPRRTDPLAALVPVERQVLALMAEGHSNTSIASRLSYSLKTVEKRVTAISQKLGLPHPESHERAHVNLRVLAVLAYLRSTRPAPDPPSPA
ncbi:response regulator transcription factor [Streptomyces ossamyceticus]|jgi:DNA-binding NarL/FixJ family response regulator|uniref:response regulator transcription factor n=1 Tax=Streptomyces ossamyceticus TaxID=249581 RepID=UPI0006E33914|nr:response regulator transcription factor [Streptomyces ossamyceticus]